MSVPVVVSKTGEAAAAVPMKGGAAALMPLSISKGGKRRMSKKTRRVLRSLKKMSPKALKAAIHGAGEVAEPVAEEGAGRRSRRRGTRRSRKSFF